MKPIQLLAFCLLLFCTFSSNSQNQKSKEFKVEFEKFTLENGLQVILHIDRSDPVVAVALTSHVGSAREKAGRTGFAHLFEHLLFLESENLGKGGLDKMSARIGEARPGRAWAASTAATAPRTWRASSARRRRARSGTCAGSTTRSKRSRWAS